MAKSELMIEFKRDKFAEAGVMAELMIDKARGKLKSEEYYLTQMADTVKIDYVKNANGAK